MKAKTDGTCGLEGLEYGSPRDYEGNSGAAIGSHAGAGNGDGARRDSGPVVDAYAVSVSRLDGWMIVD